MNLLFLFTLLVLIVGLHSIKHTKTGRCPKLPAVPKDKAQKKLCKTQGRCAKDEDCPDTQLCCGCPRQCVAPKLKKERKPRLGSCPTKVKRPLPTYCAARTDINDCGKDRPCAVGSKCCPASECGGHRCVPADRLIKRVKSPKPLRKCKSPPNPIPEICRRVRPSRSCEIGRPCSDPLKMCCEGECGGSACIGRGEKLPF